MCSYKIPSYEAVMSLLLMIPGDIFYDIISEWIDQDIYITLVLLDTVVKVNSEIRNFLVTQFEFVKSIDSDVTERIFFEWKRGYYCARLRNLKVKNITELLTYDVQKMYYVTTSIEFMNSCQNIIFLSLHECSLMENFDDSIDPILWTRGPVFLSKLAKLINSNIPSLSHCSLHDIIVYNNKNQRRSIVMHRDCYEIDDVEDFVSLMKNITFWDLRFQPCDSLLFKLVETSFESLTKISIFFGKLLTLSSLKHLFEKCKVLKYLNLYKLTISCDDLKELFNCCPQSLKEVHLGTYNLDLRTILSILSTSPYLKKVFIDHVRNVNILLKDPKAKAKLNKIVQKNNKLYCQIMYGKEDANGIGKKTHTFKYDNCNYWSRNSKLKV